MKLINILSRVRILGCISTFLFCYYPDSNTEGLVQENNGSVNHAACRMIVDAETRALGSLSSLWTSISAPENVTPKAFYTIRAVMKVVSKDFERTVEDIVNYLDSNVCPTEIHNDGSNRYKFCRNRLLDLSYQESDFVELGFEAIKIAALDSGDISYLSDRAVKEIIGQTLFEARDKIIKPALNGIADRLSSEVCP